MAFLLALNDELIDRKVLMKPVWGRVHHSASKRLRISLQTIA